MKRQRNDTKIDLFMIYFSGAEERSERGRKRREQFQEQYGIDPSDWDLQTSKVRSLLN